MVNTTSTSRRREEEEENSPTKSSVSSDMSHNSFDDDDGLEDVEEINTNQVGRVSNSSNTISTKHLLQTFTNKN